MEQEVFWCSKCKAKWVHTPLDLKPDAVGLTPRAAFCPYCGSQPVTSVQPADLHDERQLKLAVAGVR